MYEPISTTLVADCGENLKVYGKVKLPFKIDGVSFEHGFVVVELDNMSGILGIDLLNTSEAQLNISKALLIMPDETCTDRDITLKKLKVVGNIQSVSKISESLGCDKSDTEELPEHLKCMLEKVSSKLSKEQKEKIKRLIFNFQDIFLGPEGKLGRTDIVKHTIDTGDAKHIRISPRRVALAQKDIISQEIDKMLKDDIIEPSNSPWSSPNTEKAVNTQMLMPYLENHIDFVKGMIVPGVIKIKVSLGGNKWFSTIDLASGYWQCLVDEKDRPKTAFSCHRGLFQFKVMPFGLCNAPSCFERLMEIVLQGYQWERCLCCYLDDVIIFGPTFEKALENVEFVFERFRQANLKLKPKKCSLFQHQVLFLGHLITDEGIACDPSKIEAVRDWPTPKNINEVRSFLGLAGYYRRFIPKFSEIASTLTHLTKKGIRFEWTTQCQESFECLKSKLISAPILNYPSETGQFILDTDASGHAIGAVLSQIQNGEEKVLAYNGKMLSDTQRNYCTTYRELLASDEKPSREQVSGSSYEVRKLWSDWELLEKENGIWYKQYEKSSQNSLVLVVPKELRVKIMRELHNNRIAGHLGRDRTLESIRRRFYWPGMSSDVGSWVKECSI
ncbi:unnamed protein product [Mytilus coruscus]|uniref:Retrovirus-related Pol polyprotein from transposon 17.6 n=1 Tax=Mytilus coruscus TaxID=42192 RepID=A0A6J8AKY5_MYTCO|nr:unnamed protein product [Mytilus coruscus]